MLARTRLLQKTRLFSSFGFFQKPFFSQNFAHKRFFSQTPLQNFKSEKELKSPNQKETKATSQVNLLTHAYNIGAVQFLQKVYRTTGMGIFTGLMSAQCISSFGIAEQFPLWTIGIGIAGTFGLIYGLSKIKYQVKENQFGHLESVQPFERVASYYSLCFSMGAIISPMVSIIHSVSPTIFPLSIALSSLTMLGASAYAYFKPHNALSLWQGPLMGCLSGMVGMGIISLASMLILGPNAFSNMWMQVDTYGGIILFSLLTSHETYAAVKQYEEKDPDHIHCAVGLFLNFMNILIRFMEILAKHHKKD
jgi:FtsH-binding integral membrane protein